MLDDLQAFVMILVALSIAAERLVEIIKGLVPCLSQAALEENRERQRRVVLQLLAVASGIATALLARDGLPQAWQDTPRALALGLLASGGSGFWNAILTYVVKVKDIKKEQATMLRLRAAHARGDGDRS